MNQNSLIQNEKNLFKLFLKQDNEAKDFGFYWDSLEQLLNQIKSECEEIRNAEIKKDFSHLQEEIGDILHAVACLCNFFGFDLEQTFAQSIEKIQIRYDAMVSLARSEGLEDFHNLTTKEKLNYWDEAKKLIKPV